MKNTIGFVGLGSRAKNTYLPIIKKMSPLLSVVGFYVRNSTKAEAIEQEYNIGYLSSIQELLEKTPDCLIVSVPTDAQYDVLESLGSYNGVILVETPVFDHRIVNLSLNIGVLEQWPYLPLEQFKETLYNEGVIQRPFMVQNDCRSLDYHAISQLRTYLGRHFTPVSAASQGILVDIGNFIDKSGNERFAPESWDMGLVKMSNGSVISHNFAYNCKVAPFRMVQTLRGYSVNGTIITGMITQKDNDYENIDIRYLDGKETRIADVKMRRDPSNDSLIDIRDNNSNAIWTNRFAEYGLTDHQVAVAELITSACEGEALYTAMDSLIDNVIISAIRQASREEGVVKFRR
jgi:hypothetical protein